MPKNMPDSPVDEYQDRHRVKNAITKVHGFINSIVSDAQFHDKEYQGSRIVSSLSRYTNYLGFLCA